MIFENIGDCGACGQGGEHRCGCGWGKSYSASFGGGGSGFGHGGSWNTFAVENLLEHDHLSLLKIMMWIGSVICRDEIEQRNYCQRS